MFARARLRRPDDGHPPPHRWIRNPIRDQRHERRLRSTLAAAVVTLSLSFAPVRVQAQPADDAATAESTRIDEIRSETVDLDEELPRDDSNAPPQPDASTDDTSPSEASDGDDPDGSPNEASDDDEPDGSPSEAPDGDELDDSPSEAPDGDELDGDAEESDVAPTSLVPERLPRLQRIGWWNVFGAFAFATTAGVLAGLAEREEDRATRIASQFDVDAGQAPLYADRKNDYEAILRRGEAFQTSAYVVGAAAAVTAAVGLTFFILDARNAGQPKTRRARVGVGSLEVQF